MLHAVLLALLVPAAQLMFGAAAQATTYYVAPAGLDTNPGTSDQPFLTIQHAADLVNPGDAVIARDGTYTGGGLGYGNPMIHVTRSGTADAPITFRSEHRWGAVLDGQNNSTDHCWMIEASYLTVQDFEIKGFRSSGFMLNAAGVTTNVTIRGNHIHHISNAYNETPDGLDGCFDNERCQYITYDANAIHDVGRTGGAPNMDLDHGIYTCGDHNRITNNLIYNCTAGWDVQVAGYDTVDDLVVSNNTLAWGQHQTQIVVWEGSTGRGTLGVTNLTIQNNIFYAPIPDHNAIQICSFSPGGCGSQGTYFSHFTIRNNLEFGGMLGVYDDCPAVTASGNIIGADPRFVHADDPLYNFHLQAGSPAVDVGIADLAPGADLDYTARPLGAGIDLGAYECGKVTGSPFTDVPLYPPYWAFDQIVACVDANVVKGYSDGTYKPADPVTRDQMAVYTSRALAGGDANVPTGPATATFSDVPTDYWAFKYVEYAAAQNVVQGYSDGTYKPTDQVDRGQMAVFIARSIYMPTAARLDLTGYTPPATPTFPDVPTSFWAYKYVEYIAQPGIGVTKGYPDGDYHPEYICTRDQMAVYIQRAFKLPI
jgi:hypothetical protein